MAVEVKDKVVTVESAKVIYDTLDKKLSSHMNDKTNSHGVTKTQVGLGNVDNTSDLDKPVSIAQKTAIDAVSDALTEHENKKNPHGTKPSDMGITASAEELSYVAGVTSNIQTQFNELSSNISSKIIPTWTTLVVNEWQSTKGGAFESYAPYSLIATVDGVKVDNTVIVSSQFSSREEYADCNITCFAQDEKQLIFLAENLPVSDILVNIIVLNKERCLNDY